MITLIVVSESARELVVSWAPVPNATGYVFYVDGKRVSNTWDPTIKQIVFGKPDAGEHTYEVVALTMLDLGSLQWPAAAPPPPTDGWVVAPPKPPAYTITNPAGLGVNLHASSDPMTVHDTIVQGGGDSAFEIQPGAPNRTIQRCQALNVAAGNKVSYGKHAVYAKALGITVEDFAATASQYAANGLSVRYGGFLGQRCQLVGFPIPLAVFNDDPTPGVITWFQIRGTFGTVGAWLDVDEAPTMCHQVVLRQVDLTGASWFLNAKAAKLDKLASVLIDSCTLNGKPVTKSDVNGVPASQIVVS